MFSFETRHVILFREQVMNLRSKIEYVTGLKLRTTDSRCNVTTWKTVRQRIG